MTTAEQYAASVGEWATGAEAYGLITVDVPAEHWIEALTAARDTLGLGFFDWLSAVDELAEGFSVIVHLASVDAPGVRHLALRTRVPREKAALPTAVSVYAGAAWHERETHEMFGIDFPGHPYLATLLLPDGFEGHPLRKEFVLAARVAKAWPGAKEPGESDHGDGPARRKMQPAGVPDPNEWGPLKGTLPPVAERPARAARAAGAARTPRAAGAAGAAARAAGASAEGGAVVRADRPRRVRSVSDGSVSQAAGAGPEADATRAPEAAAAPAPEAPAPEAPASATGAPEAPEAPAPEAPAPGSAAPAVAGEERPGRPAPARTRSADAPWHNPVPAHDDSPKAPDADRSAEPEAPTKPESGAPAAAGDPSDGPSDGPSGKSDDGGTPAEPAGQDGDSA
ncbi:NADH-quinone oxidoreductase subunit C [Streptomyces sp. BE303]|uniref:NADH-quinone oxidoreductase subunit C n=1 Tax=Streptomyces sp. BE303 TaxID=3002528 RepID=UPI002E763213|nr:NADH-quinone oxidoreductase subunit C [Streptomyces sp. BE303]MED7951663.1 NADH-quinone oxidoreductase subunit C [Streptomyces sp. BE303]